MTERPTNRLCAIPRSLIFFISVSLVRKAGTGERRRERQPFAARIRSAFADEAEEAEVEERGGKKFMISLTSTCYVYRIPVMRSVLRFGAALNERGLAIGAETRDERRAADEETGGAERRPK